MSTETIGYEPKTIDFANVPIARKPDFEAKPEVISTPLNTEDQMISQMPDEFLDAVAIKMATQGISGLDLSTSL